MRISFKCCLCVITATLLLASCSPIEVTRGYNMEGNDLKQIIVGQSREEDVKALFGTPTTRSDFGDNTWYYISEKKETTGIFPSEVVEQHVTAIHFNTDHVVSDIAEYKKSDGKPVELVSKTTPTEGHEMSFMEQMMGSFGKFNAPGRSINPRDLGQ